MAFIHLLDVAALGLLRFCDLVTFWYVDGPLGPHLSEGRLKWSGGGPC